MYLSFSARIPVFVIFCQNSMYFIFPDRCQEMTRPEGDSQELLEMSKNIPDVGVTSAGTHVTKKVSFSRFFIFWTSSSFRIFCWTLWPNQSTYRKLWYTIITGLTCRLQRCQKIRVTGSGLARNLKKPFYRFTCFMAKPGKLQTNNWYPRIGLELRNQVVCLEFVYHV